MTTDGHVRRAHFKPCFAEPAVSSSIV